MESLSEKPSLLEKLQMAEYAAIQELTMRSAKRGKAVMCSGANLIVKREVWLECEKDLHFEIPSGDDMFLLEAIKRKRNKLTVIDEPEFTATVRPLTSWSAFFKQRMRWAGKAPHYTDRDIIRCGRLVALANILQLICPLIILIKFPIEYSLIRSRQKKSLQSPISNLQLFSIALLLEILYPFYLLICLIGGRFRKKW
jgi:cellulose synthase/poly-beta-1,6-N-acetylglucosamine synthase-like glycosyltransferase